MRTGVVLLLMLLLVGCASGREEGMAVVYGSRMRVDPTIGTSKKTAQADADELADDLAYASHWQVVSDDFGSSQPAPRPVQARPVARPRIARRVGKPKPPPKLAVPQRRSAREVRPEGKKTKKSTALLARDHYLDYPTHISAQKITLACPAALAQAARLKAEHVDRSKPGRTRAQGKARLVLRELTLQADRLTIRVHPPGKTDLQIMARGDVHLVCEVRGNVTRETGIRSLLITNDKIVPLR